MIQYPPAHRVWQGRSHCMRRTGTSLPFGSGQGEYQYCNRNTSNLKSYCCTPYRGRAWQNIELCPRMAKEYLGFSLRVRREITKAIAGHNETWGELAILSFTA